jgi:hypothetical protein
VRPGNYRATVPALLDAFSPAARPIMALCYQQLQSLTPLF